ncbi:hypothetical protein M8J77_020788 [Diaphorina citri]|nr:hypothetical protein M8J77_020788 [Diaphorina citri]
MSSQTSLSFLCHLFELNGVLDLHRPQYRYQRIYCSLQYSMFFMFLSFKLYNLFTRMTRDSTEFFKLLYTDMGILYVILSAFLLYRNHGLLTAIHCQYGSGEPAAPLRGEFEPRQTYFQD